MPTDWLFHDRRRLAKVVESQTEKEAARRRAQKRRGATEAEATNYVRR